MQKNNENENRHSSFFRIYNAIMKYSDYNEKRYKKKEKYKDCDPRKSV